MRRSWTNPRRDTPACMTVAQIRGIGLLTATAIVASMGSPDAFKDGREFAAWLCLVPRQAQEDVSGSSESASAVMPTCERY